VSTLFNAAKKPADMSISANKYSSPQSSLFAQQQASSASGNAGSFNSFGSRSSFNQQPPVTLGFNTTQPDSSSRYISCPHCNDNKKYLGDHGLNIHIGHQHKCKICKELKWNCDGVHTQGQLSIYKKNIATANNVIFFIFNSKTY